MKTYRTAIIGCGRRAYGHANAYRLISNAKLVACSNKSDLSRRRKFANTYNTASYSSAKRMIEEEKPDYMVIFAWHLTTEIIEHLRGRGYTGKFIIPLPKVEIL